MTIEGRSEIRSAEIGGRGSGRTLAKATSVERSAGSAMAVPATRTSIEPRQMSQSQEAREEQEREEKEEETVPREVSTSETPGFSRL